MKNIHLLSLLILLFTYSCVGDDFIDDEVEPTLRITNTLKSIVQDTSLQLAYSFTNNIGLPEELETTWESTEDEIADVDAEGTLTSYTKGNTIISLSVTYQGEVLVDTFHLTVSEKTIENPSSDSRTGELEASSFYDLEGTFTLSKEDDNVTLRLDSDYKADTGLPGLYVYLSNNPNSINGAYMIGAVQTFTGEHSYDLGDIDLFEYSHVLYFCKPFNVKVGDGSLSE